MALRRPLVRILGKLRILPAEDKIPFSTVDELGTAAKANITTSKLDTTPGRALKTGDFSLGLSYNVAAETLPSFKSGENLPTGAFYRAFGAGTPTPTPGTPPGSGNSQMCVISLPAFGTDQFRHWIASENGGTAATRKLWWGQTNGPTTEYWAQIYHTDNQFALGATAQSARANLTASSVVTVSASRALVIGDAGQYLRTTAAITLTVPTNATVPFPIGAEITIRAAQASGNTTIAAASGVTLVAPADGTLVLGPRMTVTLKKVGTDTWDVIGQTVPA